jgi:uncharacterized protein (TIGR02145 family)
MMKKLIASSVVLASGMFFLVGCGDENTTEITQVVGMQVLDKGEALPKCTANNEGAMVYSMDSAEAYYCVDKKWKSLDGNGGDGKNGADGEPGSAGADGKDGSSCTAKALKNGKGYKIVCGGDSVGVVLNGEKGDTGAKGDQGVKGDSGVAGANGLSAYEIAKAAGFNGSEEEWIESLKGEPGADGRNVDEGWMVDHRDYHVYKIVTIGTQTWMAENLNYEAANGCYCYNDNAEYCQKYGRLYTWAAAVAEPEDKCGYGNDCNLGKGVVRGVCPEGWHLPDTTEWNALFSAIDGAGYTGTMLKSTEGWKDTEDGSNGNGWDDFGFSALPAGSLDFSNGTYRSQGISVDFWSSTKLDSTHAHNVSLLNSLSEINMQNNAKGHAFSVRCVKD